MAVPAEVLEKLTRLQEDVDAIRTELAELDRRLGTVEDSISALILPRPPLYYSPSQKETIKCKVCGYKYTTPPNFCPKCLTPPEEPKKSSSPEPSRWVLEMYPLNVLAWRRSLIELARKPLTASEYRLVSSYDDYLRMKGYLTSRQIEVLGEIARRHDVELPAIPEVVVR